MSAKTHGEKLLRYLDGSLPDKETEELNDSLLADPDLKREFSRLLLQQVHLFDIGQSQKASPRRDRRRESNSLPTIVGLPSSWHWQPYLLAAAAAVAILLALSTVEFSSTTPRVEAFVGSDITLRRDTAVIPIKASLALKPGDILTTGKTNRLILTYRRENTRLIIGSRSSIAILPSNSGKQFKLLEGRVEAVVAHQPKAKPMLWLSAATRATIVGTEFSLTASNNTARLDVLEGLVDFESLATGQLLRVNSSRYAEVAPGVPFELRDMSNGYGSVLRETWLGIENVHIRNLTQSSKFPGNPDFRDYPATLSALTNWPGSSGVRLRAFLRVPTTGRYRFWITGADAAELRLGSNELPESAELIASLNQNASGEWERFPWQKSAAIQFVAGRKYYLEALFKQGLPGAEERAGVVWQPPGAAREQIPSRFFSPFDLSIEKGSR